MLPTAGNRAARVPGTVGVGYGWGIELPRCYNRPMATHLDTSDPQYPAAAAAILRRHDNYEAEANITTAVRDFLILTGLAEATKSSRRTRLPTAAAAPLTSPRWIPSSSSSGASALPPVSTRIRSMSSRSTTTWNSPSQTARAFAPASSPTANTGCCAGRKPGPCAPRRPTASSWSRRNGGCRCTSGCGTAPCCR